MVAKTKTEAVTVTTDEASETEYLIKQRLAELLTGIRNQDGRLYPSSRTEYKTLARFLRKITAEHGEAYLRLLDIKVGSNERGKGSARLWEELEIDADTMRGGSWSDVIARGRADD